MQSWERAAFDTKIPSKHEKAATEALLLRFLCGVTGYEI